MTHRMFHLKNGLFFRRTTDGGVRIVKTSDGLAIRSDNIGMDIKASEAEFASVMATVSAFGETGETWQQARDFLNPPYPGDDAAYRRWQKLNNNAQNPLCSCAGIGADDPHKDQCPFWQFVLTLRESWPGRKP